MSTNDYILNLLNIKDKNIVVRFHLQNSLHTRYRKFKHLTTRALLISNTIKG